MTRLTNTVRMSASNLQGLAALGIQPLGTGAVRQPDGSWLVPVGDRVREIFSRHQRSGEALQDTIDCTIDRLIRIAGSRSLEAADDQAFIDAISELNQWRED